MLAEMLDKYLTHKITLAEKSMHYRQTRLQASLSWAYSMHLHLKRYQEISDRDVALMLRGAGPHLHNLLPFEANNSYHSSVEMMNRILHLCGMLLLPGKRVQ